MYLMAALLVIAKNSHTLLTSKKIALSYLTTSGMFVPFPAVMNSLCCQQQGN
jgi:hypothetical protein